MLKALIADPLTASRQAASRMLGELGLHVIMAGSGEEALSLTASECPDLILLDSSLVAPNGRSLIDAIRRGAGGNLPCLFHVTLDGTPSNIRNAMDAGADDYLVKPYDRALLRFKLAQAKARGKLGNGYAHLRVAGGTSASVSTGWWLQRANGIA